MSRPRGISDERILDHAVEVVAANPRDWTLADIGEKAGIAAATLIQRFGSKEGIELAIVLHLNKNEDYVHQRFAVASLTFGPENRSRAGLLAFRMFAALSRNKSLRQAAIGEISQ